MTKHAARPLLLLFFRTNDAARNYYMHVIDECNEFSQKEFLPLSLSSLCSFHVIIQKLEKKSIPQTNFRLIFCCTFIRFLLQ